MLMEETLRRCRGFYQEGFEAVDLEMGEGGEYKDGGSWRVIELLADEYVSQANCVD